MLEIAAESPASGARCFIRHGASLLYQTHVSSRVSQAIGVDGTLARIVENRESASALCENWATSDLSPATPTRACSLVTEGGCAATGRWNVTGRVAIGSVVLAVSASRGHRQSPSRCYFPRVLVR